MENQLFARVQQSTQTVGSRMQPLVKILPSIVLELRIAQLVRKQQSDRMPIFVCIQTSETRFAMKNVIFEDLSRSAHLTYLGDAKVGKDVNIGCGVVTANYDGKNKYRTEIGSGSFIGSHSTLIAPVTIGENALVAAASAVSDDVEDGAMAIARTRQETKPGYGERFKNKEGK